MAALEPAPGTSYVYKPYVECTQFILASDNNTQQTGHFLTYLPFHVCKNSFTSKNYVTELRISRRPQTALNFQ
jgi:hypothetical protein